LTAPRPQGTSSPPPNNPQVNFFFPLFGYRGAAKKTTGPNPPPGAPIFPPTAPRDLRHGEGGGAGAPDAAATFFFSPPLPQGHNDHLFLFPSSLTGRIETGKRGGGPFPPAVENETSLDPGTQRGEVSREEQPHVHFSLFPLLGQAPTPSFLHQARTKRKSPSRVSASRGVRGGFFLLFPPVFFLGPRSEWKGRSSAAHLGIFPPFPSPLRGPGLRVKSKAAPGRGFRRDRGMFPFFFSFPLLGRHPGNKIREGPSGTTVKTGSHGLETVGLPLFPSSPNGGARRRIRHGSA